MITLVAFRWVPPFAQGQVRDLRVRWALEAASLPYRERLVLQCREGPTLEISALGGFRPRAKLLKSNFDPAILRLSDTWWGRYS